jgi:uncharacterized damage-inducible protein DinB
MVGEWWEPPHSCGGARLSTERPEQDESYSTSAAGFRNLPSHLASEVVKGSKLNRMIYDDLRLLIDYHYWARDRMLDAVATITPEQFLRPMGNSFHSIRDTFAHICAAERIWITRLKGEKPQGLQKPDRLPDVDAVRKEWTELEGEMREQFARLGPEAVERTIEYQDLRGDDQSDVLWQILQHVVNHATYHRGQITTMLRQLDAVPPKSMDLIAFYRERNRKA